MDDGLAMSLAEEAAPPAKAELRLWLRLLTTSSLIEGVVALEEGPAVRLERLLHHAPALHVAGEEHQAHRLVDGVRGAVLVWKRAGREGAPHAQRLGPGARGDEQQDEESGESRGVHGHLLCGRGSLAVARRRSPRPDRIP